MQFFGERWDAPAFEQAVEVPVPVGQTCLLCTETIEAADSGIVTPYIDARGARRDSPVHIECHLRSVLGTVSHLEHRCSCVTGRKADDFTSATFREEARDTLLWLQQHGDAS